MEKGLGKYLSHFNLLSINYIILCLAAKRGGDKLPMTPRWITEWPGSEIIFMTNCSSIKCCIKHRRYSF